MKQKESSLISMLNIINEKYNKFDEEYDLSNQEHWKIRAESLQRAIKVLDEKLLILLPE